MQATYSLMKYLLYPEVWILIVLLLACLTSWTTHCSRSVRFLLVVLTVLYYGFTTRPLTQALVDPLETYERPPLMLPQSDAIVLFVNDAPQLEAFSRRPTVVGTDNAHLLICGLTYVQAHTAPLVVLAESVPASSPLDAMPRRCCRNGLSVWDTLKMRSSQLPGQDLRMNALLRSSSCLVPRIAFFY